MLDSLREKMKAEYEKQNRMAATPDAPEAKATARKGGVVMLILGLVGLGANWYAWTYWGTLHSLLIAATLVFLVLGVWVSITGKMPIGRRKIPRNKPSRL